MRENHYLKLKKLKTPAICFPNLPCNCDKNIRSGFSQSDTPRKGGGRGRRGGSNTAAAARTTATHSGEAGGKSKG